MLDLNLQAIAERYARHAYLSLLSESIHNKNKFQIVDLAGSSLAFFINSIPAKGIVVILPNKESAAYTYNDLQQLSSDDILFLNDSFKSSEQMNALSNSNVLLRSEALAQLSNSSKKKKIVVSYPSAVLEQVYAQEDIESRSIHVRINEKINRNRFIEKLIEQGFERVDFVVRPCQFSVRGGIIDVFTFGNELPYRIDFFDDEVESIRCFELETQLSVKNISHFSITPNVQQQTLRKVTFFDSIPNDYVVVSHSLDELRDLLIKSFEQYEAYRQKNKGNEISDELNAFYENETMDKPDLVFASLQRKNLIEIISSESAYSFKTKPQPSFNKDFSLIIQTFEELKKSGFELFLFAEQAKQIERLYQIFADLKANITFTPIYHPLSAGYIDEQLKIACFTDHQLFNRYHKYQLKKGFEHNETLTLKELQGLHPGDYVTHIDHGVGKYSGLEKIIVNGVQQEAVRLLYRDNDILYVSINALHKISKYVGKEGKPPTIHKLGTETWQNLKNKTKKKVKEIAFDLIKLYAKRKATKGFAYSNDTYLQTELEASFEYEDTPDQLKATDDVKRDMQNMAPMDRLICGDVGFGKTEVAIRAAFKAACDGKQTAVLVPTTILAYQHFKTFSQRLQHLPCKVDYINRFKTTKEKNITMEGVKRGETDILIGTHAILNDKIQYKDLGLLIIDEEQKFGVSAKEKIRNIKNNIDTLTLTATPIPRTLQFSLMSARDLSIINTPPPNRQPIHTEIKLLNEEFIRDAIYFEIFRGGQVFFVHNRIQDLKEVMNMLQKFCPDLSFAMAHGQLPGDDLEQILLDFIERKYDVLVCTNIVEAGVDIPNVNTIIINHAHWYGLSDLHQLRGRVGRSNKKAFCYLLTPPFSTITREAKTRLQTLEQFNELGSGFKIAMRDLDLRGAGNLFGGEQSGFIFDIGYNTFYKILDQAVQELKESDFADVFEEQLLSTKNFSNDCIIESDEEYLIPDSYVQSIDERLLLYTRLDSIEDELTLKKFLSDLEDRFGKIPKEVVKLTKALQLRWLGQHLGFERIVIKNNEMKCYLIENQHSFYYKSAIFEKLLQFIAQHAGNSKLKQTPKGLLFITQGIANIHQANVVLSKISV